jgi:uncharacterized protein YqkB
MIPLLKNMKKEFFDDEKAIQYLLKEGVIAMKTKCNVCSCDIRREGRY